MDEATLTALTAALAASPENQPLRLVLARAHHERQDDVAAWRLLAGLDPGSLAPAERRLVAAVALAAGEPAAALAAADGAEGEDLILATRALLALERVAEARRRYETAVGANPTLEDLALRERLSSTVRSFAPRDGRPALRVISNDDTDQSETRRLLVPDPEPVTFADVGGHDEIKEQIRRRIILPFQKPSLFERFKRRVGGGILLYGPPGCGKTLLARATAGECKASFWNVAIAEILDMYIGESERKLHAIFEQARAQKPAVVFFDEIEALGGKRQYTREGTSSKLVSQFLAELDGFANQANEGILVLGATNVPWAIDPAFRRPGRFDRLFFVPPPDQAARAAILALLLAGRPFTGEAALGRIAQATSGFSGADLRNLVETATDQAISASLDRGEEVPLDQELLERALREVKPTTLEWLTTARNYARYANEGGQYDEVLRFLEKHGKK